MSYNTVMRLACWIAFFALRVVAAQLTPEQWRQDLNLLATEMPKLHKNLFFQLPKSEFEKQVRELDAAIPKLTDLEIRASLVRLLASVGNAHTTIDAFSGTPSFPIQFSIFPEGVFVTGAAAEHSEALGARLLAVNGVPVDEARRKLLPYFAKENDVAPLVSTPNLLRSAAAMNAAGITTDLVHAEYTLEKSGARSQLTLVAARVPITSVPGGTKRRDADYAFTYLPESKMVYLQYNACRNSKDKSFADFTAEVMKTVDSNPVSNFVVDLRFNGGGNSQVIEPLLAALKSRSKLKVYALVGRYTFSSGFMAARDLRDKCHAKLVGEAMGQRPNSYGDIRPLKLPNSGLTAYYCTKFFKLSNRDVPAVEPDVKVPTTAADYFSGKDPVMNYVIAH